jgi:hypothetical protein
MATAAPAVVLAPTAMSPSTLPWLPFICIARLGTRPKIRASFAERFDTAGYVESFGKTGSSTLWHSEAATGRQQHWLSSLLRISRHGECATRGG